MESNLKHRLSQDGAPLIPKLPLQTRHINHKAIFHIAFLHTLIGGVDVLHINHLHIWHDIILGTKIQHFLGFGNAANHRRRNATATHNHRHGVNGLFQLAHQTDQHQRTVQGKCRHIRL